MKLRVTYIALLSLLSPSSGQRTQKKEKEVTGTGSFVLSTLLETLSSNKVSPSCPGRCFNAIAAFACQEVLDEPGHCPTPGYRCCKNIAAKVRDESEPQEATDDNTTELPGEIETLSTWGGVVGEGTTATDNGEVSPTSSTKAESAKNQEEAQTAAEEKMDVFDSDTSPLDGPSRSVKVCPGVCVAQRISNFCEAVIEVEGLCKTQLRCCVSANLFDGVDNPPKEFVILNPGNGTNDESRSEMTDIPKRDTTLTTLTTASTTTTAATKATSTTTTSIRRPTETHLEQPSGKDDKTPPVEENDGIPPEKRCKGTCVAGFFAFLCDSIDRNGLCPHGGRCCVTQRRTRPRPGPGQEEQNDNNEYIVRDPVTTSKPRRRTSTATSTATTETKVVTTPVAPTTKSSTKPPPPPCPGTCLPVSLASRCQAPSRLVVATGCSDDEICCNDKGKQSPKPTSSQMPQALGTLLSLFGGGSSSDSRPPTPPRRTMAPTPPTTTATTTTTSTTTPTPTTVVTEPPDCPGTCIAPILSFTCFGNAEMTTLFKCENGKQGCCAPKSAIRERTRHQEMDFIAARNDTVLPSSFNQYGSYNPQGQGQPIYNHYEQSHYPAGGYGQAGVAPLHGQQAGEGYHSLYYHGQPQGQQQYQQYYEQSSYDNSAYDESSQDPHYEQPPQQPIFSHPPPESNQYQASVTRPQPHHQYPHPPTHHIPQPHLQPPTSPEASGRHPYPQQPTAPPQLLSSTVTNVPFWDGSEQHVDEKYVCGVKGTNREARVVGGEDAVPGEWCWQVALINSLNQYLCGGALIGTQWVLTAAHCVTNIVRSGDAIYVRVGDHDLTTRFGSPGAQTVPVATTYIHHNHNSQTLDNDIALLKLSSHAELGDGVCLVCLPARGVGQVAGKRCTVTGYGYMGETGPIPLRVREAEIPVVSDNECVRKINAVTEKIFILPASSFCAGGESGHDACQGDGGGPLVCNVDGYYELSGLVSWGFGCGRKDVPGVYVKVSSFIGWVNQIISVNNL